MSIESKSQELKDLVSTYDTQWFLGNLSALMDNIAKGRAEDQLGRLSSPLRQLYFLGGLLISTNPTLGTKNQYSNEEWAQIVKLLNDIETEYDKIFFPKTDEEVNDEWKRIRDVAMPSFLSYFNQGPLNYEEQTINWIRDLYSQLDSIVESITHLKTEEFIQFYENLDSLVQKNFQGFSTKGGSLRPDWKKYTKLEISHSEDMPEMLTELFEERLPLMTFVADHGIIDRFYPHELVSTSLTIDKVNLIIGLLSCSRSQTDFQYYTATKPGNPLYEKPIINIGEGMYQVFEVKQVIHAIENLLENTCSLTTDTTSKLVNKKAINLKNEL